MDLSDLVDKFGPSKQGSARSFSGASAAMFGLIKNEWQTATLLGSNFWRQWLLSDEAAGIAGKLGVPSFLGARVAVVPRKELDRIDLVVFSPQLAQGSSLDVLEIKPSAAAVAEGYGRLSPDTKLPPTMADLELRAAQEFAAAQPVAVISVPEPRWERLALPAVAQRVSTPTEESTVGVLVRDRGNPKLAGVTAALHALPAGARIEVEGRKASLCRSDAVTDSAFVTVSLAHPTFRSPVSGILKGKTPRGKQDASFVGLKSGLTDTRIVGWDPQIPSPSRNRQALVYTRRDGQPGDSGSALLSDDNVIVGFLFERTLPGEDPEQCSWIWANSVMDALDVELI